MKAKFVNNIEDKQDIIESVTSENLSAAGELSGIENYGYDLDFTTVEGYIQFWKNMFYENIPEKDGLILKTLHEWELEGIILQPHEGFRLHSPYREMENLESLISKNSEEFPYVYNTDEQYAGHPYFYMNPPYISPVFSKIEFPNAQKITVLDNGIDIGDTQFIGG